LVSEKTPAHIRKWLELMETTFTNKFEKRSEVDEEDFRDENLIFVDILNSIQF